MKVPMSKEYKAILSNPKSREELNRYMLNPSSLEEEKVIKVNNKQYTIGLIRDYPEKQ